MNIEMFIRKLHEFDALRDRDLRQVRTVDRIQPPRAQHWPHELDGAVRNALAEAGFSQPYTYQAEAVIRSLAGDDVVMESPTASGKTLAFTAPMLHFLKRERLSHALMIYPMKALAFDQRAQIRQLCERLGIESWSYDRDVPKEHRNALRANPPQILLTNPEYLNMSFLGYRNQWQGFLGNLRYVVIDEMHEYRGYFGANMALLLRRFFLHLNRIGASPQVFLSTATCDNPKEHARNLTGRDLEVVSSRDVYRPKRHFIFTNPSISDYRYRDILRLRVEQAALASLAFGKQVLVFCPTKKFLESAFGASRRKAQENNLDSEAMSIFHADLKSEKRQEIQRGVKAGDIKVVFTTNALELGLDIGGLDGVILAGFPSSLMSAWQQIGRAGRSWDKDAFVLYYPMNDPMDRFFAGNLDAFLDKPFDALVVDPSNEELIKKHLAALVSETNGSFSPADEGVLGESFYRKAVEERATPIRGYKPHPHVDIRGSYGRSYELRRGGKEIGQISEMRRFREAYLGAVFPFFGQKYRVHSHEEGAVVLKECDANLRTDPGFYHILSRGSLIDGLRYRELDIYHGVLNISTNFSGYKLVDESSGEVKESITSAEAHYQDSLHAFWIDIAQGVDLEPGAVGALEHLIRVGAMFVVPADRFDTSTYSKTGDEPGVYYYENYSGGIGLAKKVFEKWRQVLAEGVRIAASCGCRSGCQNCIEPAKVFRGGKGSIDKENGIDLASYLLDAVDRPSSARLFNGRMVPLS